MQNDVDLHAKSSLLLGNNFGYGCISYAHARLDKMTNIATSGKCINHGYISKKC